ncbi:hypothetical protein CC86DRAFT_389221 [Ophiobolus disseminans]|uniref:Protein kinase domain-containing protein n=1 Tax=Ophiobolus disseminans TaxID=1469910 RepID=A0A6A6ZCL8_9PLEO|nr:hypothetical protein CC86DRAFT_389221 [Ophiobolus disseminans]
MNERRQTRIEFDALGVGRDRTSQTGEAQNATRKRSAYDASLEDLVSARRHGVVYPMNTEKRPQLARPPEFPINTNGLVKQGDPWLEFEQSYRLRLGVNYRIVVAERKTSPYDIVAIRTFAGAMDDSQVRVLQGIQHDNFARVLNVFRSTEATHVAFEHAHVSLHEISKSCIRITKVQLAAVMGQLINGLAYLSIQDLEHGSLSRTNILVTIDGVVKIAAYEGCSRRTSEGSESSDLKALRRIATELMQHGRTKEVDIVSVKDLSVWEPDVAGFLAETTSALSPNKLKKVNNTKFSVPSAMESTALETTGSRHDYVCQNGHLGRGRCLSLVSSSRGGVKPGETAYLARLTACDP